MKKIAVVGANSYIARNMIYVLKNEYENCELKLYDYAESHWDGEHNYRQINIMDINSIENIDFDCDIIYFFVGKTGSINGFDDYISFIDINEKALLNFLTVYRKKKSQAKIVFPSTRLVYKGNDGVLSEEAEKECKTVYAINKLACEKYLEQYNNVFDIQYCIVRICVPYGSMISGASSYGTAEFMLKNASEGRNITIYGDGEVRRTLTYVGDLCRILLKIGFTPECRNDVYNIGGEDYSLNEMAMLIAEKYNVKIDYIDYPNVALKIESGSTVFDDSKLKKLISVEYNTKFSDWCHNQERFNIC